MEQTSHQESTANPTILLLYSLGPLTLLHRDPLTGKVTVVPKEKLYGKGGMPALELLGILLSQPDRTATRDWVLEQLWPEAKKSQAEDRLNDVVYDLRARLRNPSGPIGQFVDYVRGTRGSAGVYSLAAYPRVWHDAEAFLWHMQHAALYERMNDDPLPCLEAAYQLGSRGTYLAEKPYSDWAQPRREELDGAFRLCVHKIGRLYLERGSLLEAELAVRKYWATHMTDEDALRLLMDILGEQQRYQEAFSCYQQTYRLREEEGEPIDPRTQDLAEYWRTKPLIRPAKSSPQPSAVPPSQPSSLVAYENVIHFLQVIQALLPKIVSNGEVLSVLPESDTALVTVLPTLGPSPAIPSSDLGTWLSHKANELRAIGISGPPITDQKRQADVDTEIESWNRMFDQNHPQRNEFLSTRRAVLADLALVSASVLTWVRSGKMTLIIAKEFLAQCTTSIMACYHLLKGDGFLPVEYALSQYLPHLITLAKSPSPFQKEAAYLAAQGCCLMATVKGHQLQFSGKVAHCSQAVELANVTGDSVLVAATLTRLGVAWFDFGESLKMLQAFQDAERLLPKEAELLQFFPPRLRSRIYTGLADAHALCGHPQDADCYLGLANEISLRSGDNLFIPALDYDLSFKILWEGMVHFNLGELKEQNGHHDAAQSHFKNAEAALGQALSESDDVTERGIIEIVNLRTVVYVKLGNIGDFAKSLKKGALGAKSLGSKKREKEARDAWRAGLERWQYEDQVTKLWEWVL